MKIKIKIKKCIDEISAMGAGMVVGGPAVDDDSKKLEEIGQMGIKVANARDDADEWSAKTFDGAREREDHGDDFNLALNPRPSMHKLEEEDEIEEQMHTMVGRNDTLGTIFAQGDDEPHPAAWENSRKRSFDRKGDRARYPEGDVLARNAKYGLEEVKNIFKKMLPYLRK